MTPNPLNKTDLTQFTGSEHWYPSGSTVISNAAYQPFGPVASWSETNARLSLLTYLLPSTNEMTQIQA